MKTRLFASLVTALVLTLGASSLAQDETTLNVTEIVTARGYERATGPVDPTTSFAHASGNLFVIIRLENPTGAESDIHVSFERDEGEPAATASAGGLALHVPASRRYRTFARATTNRPAGAYRAVVRDDAGGLLSSVDFTIE
jgi:hypothetical protein